MKSDRELEISFHLNDDFKMTKEKCIFDANHKSHIYELIRQQGLTFAQVCTDYRLGQSAV